MPNRGWDETSGRMDCEQGAHSTGKGKKTPSPSFPVMTTTARQFEQGGWVSNELPNADVPTQLKASKYRAGNANSNPKYNVADYPPTGITEGP